MTQTSLKLTFEEYLTYDDGTDNRYELVDGELVMVPLPTGEHSDAIDLLSDIFKAEITKQQQPWIVKRDVGVYVGINPDKTDYQAKEQEYRTIGIPEYWIVDLRKAEVSVLLLVDGGYQSTEFKGTELIVSRTFSQLNLTAQQVLTA